MFTGSDNRLTILWPIPDPVSGCENADLCEDPDGQDHHP